MRANSFGRKAVAKLHNRQLHAYSRNVTHLPDGSLGLKICRTSLADGRGDSNIVALEFSDDRRLLKPSQNRQKGGSPPGGTRTLSRREIN